MKMPASVMHKAATVLAVAAAFAFAPLVQDFARGADLQATQDYRPQDYRPQVGQEGKDVVWVPTGQALVNKMLDLAQVTPHDFVVDLGSGDGRTVITAAKRGARAHGIEYNPDMVTLSRQNAEKARVSKRATFERADIFETDFSHATVLTMFLLPNLNVKLLPTILKMKPGTRVVTNSFSMGDWQPDAKDSVELGCVSYCNAYLWIVPANVAGAWKMPQGELALQQNYQMLSGHLKLAGKIVELTEGRLTGEEIFFSTGDAQFFGRIAGDKIEGVLKTATGETRIQAQRTN